MEQRITVLPNAKSVYIALSAVCLFAAMVEPTYRRFAWAAFAFAFICAADKIKDVEKAKRKERIETENRMTKEMLEGWDKSLGERYKQFTTQIAATSEILLKQLSTYVRDASPTRTDRALEVECPSCQKADGKDVA